MITTHLPHKFVGIATKLLWLYPNFFSKQKKKAKINVKIILKREMPSEITKRYSDTLTSTLLHYIPGLKITKPPWCTPSLLMESFPMVTQE
jgi:hypothetical protein